MLTQRLSARLSTFAVETPVRAGLSSAPMELSSTSNTSSVTGGSTLTVTQPPTSMTLTMSLETFLPGIQIKLPRALELLLLESGPEETALITMALEMI